MRAEEGEKKMTKRIEVARAPAPLEEYSKHSDRLFGKTNQREGFWQYLEGLLLPHFCRRYCRPGFYAEPGALSWRYSIDFLGIIGEYPGRIYDEVRARPWEVLE
jgi:hypothetical protein